jgi:hypothetical protein
VALTLACVLIFIWQASLGQAGFEKILYGLGFIPALVFTDARLEPDVAHARVLVFIPFGLLSRLVSLPALWILSFWFIFQVLNSVLMTTEQGVWPFSPMRAVSSPAWY